VESNTRVSAIWILHMRLAIYNTSNINELTQNASLMVSLPHMDGHHSSVFIMLMEGCHGSVLFVMLMEGHHSSVLFVMFMEDHHSSVLFVMFILMSWNDRTCD
jgi:hypothetical protein